MIFLNKPKDSLAPDDGRQRPLRIMGQVAGEKGEIIDVATGKVIGTMDPAPKKDDGLGEGDERLEVVDEP